MASLTLSTSAVADTSVEFWHSFSNSSGETLEKIIEKFEAENPDIQVEAKNIGNYNDIVAKLQAAIPAKRYPDAVILEVTRYGLFADRGVLEDLTPYLEKDPLKDELFEFAREVGVYEGKNYIVPFNSSTPVLYVNKGILRSAGMETVPEMTTWDQITDVARTVSEKLQAENVKGIVAPGQFARWGLVMGNDSDLIDSRSGNVLLDSPATIEAYQWMSDLVHTWQLASADGVTDESAGKNAFTAGKVALNINSTGNYSGLLDALGEDLLVLPMPCNAVCRVPIGGAGIGILEGADQEKKDAAYKLVSYLASAEANAIWFAETGYMPINANTADVDVAADALATQPGIRVAIDQLDFARGRPRPPVVTWMRSREYDMWQAMALGQRPVEETLQEFAELTRAEASRTE
ncbi:ABC transporter substrate-binding protein [Granulosicoccus sp. 3-233]|uniref:ABC transporter substrate-binding protein n=1 Tax=Granulosicoccus sp. 3-233 TaxID=3417969 RepID=UPI003D34F65E